MNWFFIALFAPALWAITNHLDKYLLSKYVKGATAGALVLFSALFGLFALPFALIFGAQISGLNMSSIVLLLLSGSLYVVGIIPYLYALQDEEASIVIPMFQTISVFGYIYGYLFLGEVLNTQQILAAILIISGAVGISLDLNHKIPKLKIKPFAYMLLASIIFATVDFLFKFVSIEEGYWTGIFWHFAGYIVFAVFAWVFLKSYKVQFLKMIRENKAAVFGLNSINEIVNIVARGIFSFASLLAPLALVQVVSGFQPFFVFMYGLLITLFLPSIGKESLTRRSITQKVLAIIVIFIGTYFLQISSS